MCTVNGRTEVSAMLHHVFYERLVIALHELSALH
jgi:hypothetical protein